MLLMKGIHCHELAQGYSLPKKVRMKWPNNIPTRNSLFGPVVGASENIRAKKNAVV